MAKPENLAQAMEQRLSRNRRVIPKRAKGAPAMHPVLAQAKRIYDGKRGHAKR